MEDLEKGKESKDFEPITSPPAAMLNPENGQLTTKEQVGDISTSQPQQASVTDWDGPNDLANPHNWPLLKKVYHVTIPGLFGFAVTFGTSVYTPAVADLMQHFHISRTAALVGLTVYTLGLAFGPMFSAPLSEKFGRKIVYVGSSPIFMLFILGAGFSKSFASLVVCRFFAGLTGSPALAVGAGTTADLFLPKQRAVVSSLFLAAPFAGPSLGPVVGGFAAQNKSWRWSEWCILFVSLTVFLLALPMQETYKPIVLARRAKFLGIAPPATKSAKTAIIQTFVRPSHMLVTEPVVFFLSLYTAFAFGILFLLFAALPVIFQGAPYHFTTSQTGLIFLAIGLGVLLASGTSVLIDRLIYQRHHSLALSSGSKNAAPEHRLYNAMIGSFGIPVGLFWMAWSADKGTHWIVPTLALIPFAWGNLCLFTSAVLYMVDCYGPMNGASAVAANGILRYTLGAVFPLFTVQMYHGLGTGWATSLLGFLSVLMLPIPWVFYKWGPEIRRRSRYPVVM